jgi:hypothetical protein
LLSETLIYMVLDIGVTFQYIGVGMADSRVWIPFFHARKLISTGFKGMPTPTPAGTGLHPSCLTFAGLRIFAARCHHYLYTPPH